MLDRQFGIERAKASQRIIDLSARHEMIIADFIRNNLSFTKSGRADIGMKIFCSIQALEFGKKV